jgi:hypothetical protein
MYHAAPRGVNEDSPKGPKAAPWAAPPCTAPHAALGPAGMHREGRR